MNKNNDEHFLEDILEYNQASIGQKVISFEMRTLEIDRTFGKFDLQKVLESGKWVVLYFYPADFSFVCPTEIEGFMELNGEFEKEEAVLIGVSTDKVYSHLGWVNERKWEIKHPLASDPSGRIARYFGIYDEIKGIAYRGTFIISPDGVLWHIAINFGDSGRDPKEVLRTLEVVKNAHQGKLVPCNWKKGDKFIKKEG